MSSFTPLLFHKRVATHSLHRLAANPSMGTPVVCDDVTDTVSGLPHITQQVITITRATRARGKVGSYRYIVLCFSVVFPCWVVVDSTYL